MSFTALITKVLATKALTMTRTAAIAGASLALLAPAAEARDPYAAQVDRQLANFKRAAIHEGAYGDRGQHIGKLTQGQRYERLMTLEKGEFYVFGAACDADCKHIRLQVLDESNRVVGDSQSSRPSVEVAPRWTRQFRVVVDMTGCREDECHFGVTMAAQ